MPDLLLRNLIVLTANGEVRRGSSALLFEVVGSTSCALVLHLASSVGDHEGILVICQTEDGGSFAAYPAGMTFAIPFALQVLSTAFSATKGPLADGSPLRPSYDWLRLL